MELSTARLHLRELTLTDVPDVHALHSMPEVDEYNTLGIPLNLQTTETLLKQWIEQQKASPRVTYIFCIHHIKTTEFIGLIALHVGKPNFKNAETWYKIHPAHWRQGYASEALAKVLAFGFRTLGLHRIEAGCAVENIGSIKVLEKAGMMREGRKRKVLPIRGEWIDSYFYAILETDFEATRKLSLKL